jgi:hypothetical protein
MLNCELCDLANGNIITKKYYEDEEFICVDCSTCRIPMIVLKRHSPSLTKEERAKADTLLTELFPSGAWRKDGMRKIKMHWHQHIIL